MRPSPEMRSSSIHEREDDDDDDSVSVLSVLSGITSSVAGAHSMKIHHRMCPRNRLSEANSSKSIHNFVQAACDNHIAPRIVEMGILSVSVVFLVVFMYTFPIMRKVELMSLEKALHEKVYCQEAAIDSLIVHIRGYVEREHKGVVVLFLAGSEGSGKTLTLDTLRDVNPNWKKMVAIHEQGYLNKLSQEELIATVRSGIHASTLNFFFIDDIPNLAEGTPFVEMKLKPVLRALKFEKSLVFVMMTSYGGSTSLPKYLTNEFEHQTVLYEALPRPCVEKCAVDVIRALGADPSNIDLEALMDQMSFDVVDGIQVSRDGCKTVHKIVALFLSEMVIEKEGASECPHTEQNPTTCDVVDGEDISSER